LLRFVFFFQVSLLSNAAINEVADPDTPRFAQMAMVLALLSGVIQVSMLLLLLLLLLSLLGFASTDLCCCVYGSNTDCARCSECWVLDQLLVPSGAERLHKRSWCVVWGGVHVVLHRACK